MLPALGVGVAALRLAASNAVVRAAWHWPSCVSLGRRQGLHVQAALQHRQHHPLLTVSEEVADALAANKGVVALESTIISHDMVRSIAARAYVQVLREGEKR